MLFFFQITMMLALLGCGTLARRRGVLTETGTREIARLALDFAFPPLIFLSVVALSPADLRANALLPPAAAGICLAGLLVALLAIPLALRRASSATRRAFAFQCLVNNYLFLPLPIVSRLYGPRGVGLLVFASLGIEIVLWTVGVFLFTSRASLRTALRDLLSPPLVALLLGLLCIFVRPHLPTVTTPLLHAAVDAVRDGLGILSGAALAMAMLVAGSRFAVLPLSALRAPAVLLLTALRLLAIPLLAVPLLRLVPLPADARVILAVVAAMPAAVVSSLLAERYGGDLPFISATLLLTHLLSLLTVPLVMHLFA